MLNIEPDLAGLDLADKLVEAIEKNSLATALLSYLGKGITELVCCMSRDYLHEFGATSPTHLSFCERRW